MIFITGGTGYLGSYVVTRILETTDHEICILVRGETDQAKEKLWNALQLHMDEKTFLQFFETRIKIVSGDVSQKRIGFDQKTFDSVTQNISSIIHCAASLNRKSETKCAQINLMGTLHMIELAKASPKLTRFSFVSTVAVAGERSHEVVIEENSIDWQRRDYDPYARTKKFCEEMVQSSLSNLSVIIFRPSIVLGDSRFSQTTQFDMAFAFAKLSRFPILPFDPAWKLDIVPANFVGFSIADIHCKEKPEHAIYHLSSGKQSPTFEEIAKTLHQSGYHRKTLFAPFLLKPFTWIINALNYLPRNLFITKAAALMKVFLPYLAFDTVFDHEKITQELQNKPESFTQYCSGFYEFVQKNKFRYPYKKLQKG
ncbi:MAG: SDR family oxidoreductase [Bdellovibrionales bacterium]|nr:SDR family oxidoreductase [Bdellovibrionales bacterium]